MFTNINNSSKNRNSVDYSDLRLAGQEKIKEFFPNLHSNRQQVIEDIHITKITDTVLTAEIPISLEKDGIEWRGGIPISLRPSNRYTNLFKVDENGQPRLYRGSDAGEIAESIIRENDGVALALLYRISARATKSFTYTAGLKIMSGDDVYYLNSFAGTIEIRDVLNAENTIADVKEKIERKTHYRLEVSLDF